MTEPGEPGHGATDPAPADLPAEGQGADATVLTGPSVTAAPGVEPTATPAEREDSVSSDSARAGGGGSEMPIVSDPAITAPPPDYTAGGVPSLDFVRDKIEGRYANALGATELAEDVIPEVKSAAKQAAEREEAARDKLEAIRRSMRGESDS